MPKRKGAKPAKRPRNGKTPDATPRWIQLFELGYLGFSDAYSWTFGVGVSEAGFALSASCSSLSGDEDAQLPDVEGIANGAQLYESLLALLSDWMITWEERHIDAAVEALREHFPVVADDFRRAHFGEEEQEGDEVENTGEADESRAPENSGKTTGRKNQMANRIPDDWETFPSASKDSPIYTSGPQIFAPASRPSTPTSSPATDGTKPESPPEK